MDVLEFDLERMERELTLQNYEMVKPHVEKLLGAGYTPVRAAALMFRYGYVWGRKLLRDSQKERRQPQWEELHKPKDEDKSLTSGENEGSV